MSRRTSSKSTPAPSSATPDEQASEGAKKTLERRHIARELLRPSTLAANAIDALKMTPLTDADALIGALREQVELVTAKDDLSCAEGMLICQAHTLDAIFNRELMAAKQQEYLSQFEAHMKVALRAQTQCRATLETLATIKNPPIFARQANIAHGPQQVNNSAAPPGEPSRAEESEIAPNRLLEHQHGERLDTLTASAASGGDSAMATLGRVDRAEVHER